MKTCRGEDRYRRSIVWAGIVIVFLFVELALWAPTLTIRNRWSAIAAITILVIILIDLVTGRSSPGRLGVGLPKMSVAGLVVGIGFTTAAFILVLARLAGSPIPANSYWADWHSVWGYAIWALLQEFILQSFFFNRFEELYGSSTAVWMASTLFAAAHLPNPILTTFTFIGALFFCEVFRRYRSIYPLAIVHAMLGPAIALTVPDSLLHHMRVGIGYLRY